MGEIPQYHVAQLVRRVYDRYIVPQAEHLKARVAAIENGKYDAMLDELPAKFIQFKRHGIDISKEPMLVYPTPHYQNGGVNVNGDTETCVPGLYADGEAIGGVHGENRLMGNSLQDIITFGRRAGKNTAAYVQAGVELKALTLDHVAKFEKELDQAGIPSPGVAPILLPDYSTDEMTARRWP